MLPHMQIQGLTCLASTNKTGKRTMSPTGAGSNSLHGEELVAQAKHPEQDETPTRSYLSHQSHTLCHSRISQERNSNPGGGGGMLRHSRCGLEVKWTVRLWKKNKTSRIKNMGQPRVGHFGMRLDRKSWKAPMSTKWRRKGWEIIAKERCWLPFNQQMLNKNISIKTKTRSKFSPICLALNLWSSCFSLKSTGIRNMHHCTQFRTPL